MSLEITNWLDVFENADTRKRVRLGWINTPTGCDSRGYRQLVRDGSEGLAAIGVFQALCQCMGTMPKPRGKFLHSDGSLMDIEDISDLTRIQPADIRHATGRLVRVGWIKELQPLRNKESAGHLPVICQSSPSFVQGKGKGEVKGEGEGEDKESLPLPFDSEEFEAAWGDWIAFRKMKKKKISEHSMKLQFKAFQEWGESASIESINNSIRCDYQGIFPPKGGQLKASKPGGNHAGIFESEMEGF